MLFVVLAYFAHVIENSLIAYLIKDIGPYIYLPISYFISTLTIFCYGKFINFNKKVEKIDWHLALSCKFPFLSYIGGALIGNALWFVSIFLIGLSSVSFIMVFIRLFVAVYAYFFMDDRYPVNKIIAFGLAFIALCFYSYSSLENNQLGIALALLSCIAFSAESIGKKKLALSGLKVENMVLWRYFIMMVAFISAFVLLYSFNMIPSDMLNMPSNTQLFLMIVTCFFGSVGAGVLLFYGLRTIPLSIVEALNTTKPVLFSIIGIFFLGEVMTGEQIFWGIVIVITSLYFVMAPNEKEKRKIA